MANEFLSVIEIVIQPKFGIELEFFLVDEQGFPVLGSAAKVIDLWQEDRNPSPPVSELGSFQIELNPGPWPLTPSGVSTALNELQRDVNCLNKYAATIGTTVCYSTFIPKLSETHLKDQAFYTDDDRSRATSAYFSNNQIELELVDGEAILFYGESLLACLNEIHITLQMSTDVETLRLFNYFNKHGLEIVEPYQQPILFNDRYFAKECTTMRIFERSHGMFNSNKTIRRVGFLPYDISSYNQYQDIVASFEPIPFQNDTSHFLKLESSVWFWVRLRGTPGDLRVEFRPMDMGANWDQRVKYLAQISQKFHQSYNL